MTYLDFVVNGGNQPWDAEAKKHIDGVAAGDVPDGIISRFFGYCRDFTGKCVRK